MAFTYTANHVSNARLSALDECWEIVNAMGGVAQNANEEAANRLIDRILAEIEELGGMDPGERRRREHEAEYQKERMAGLRKIFPLAAE